MDAMQTPGDDAFANPRRRESDGGELREGADTVLSSSELGKLGV